MKLTLLLVLNFSVFLSLVFCTKNEEPDDFDFTLEEKNSTNFQDENNFENYVDDLNEDVEDLDLGDVEESLGTSSLPFQANSSPLLTMKAVLVRRHLLESMQTKEMKKQVARVLPILRVMTPEQKLALATLVTTQIVAPEEQQLTLDQVSSIFGNNPNTTEDLMLPISLDIANMFSRRHGRSIDLENFLNSTSKNETDLQKTLDSDSDGESTTEMPEELPSAEQLRGGRIRPPKRRIGGSYRPFAPPLPPRFRPGAAKPKPGGPKPNLIKMDHTNCEMFGSTICLRAKDYPHEAIMASIRRNKQAIASLIADFRHNFDNNDPTSNSIENYSENRRGGSDGGYMCKSDVKFTRPQGAKSTKGKWKFIVNMGGEHTQTLRLERCDRPNGACSYLNDNYSSRCVQLYNYHRLLAWDQNQGLHMDIFKVPSCCSCHIDNYKVAYPPHHPNINHVPSSEDEYPEDPAFEQDDHHRSQHIPEESQNLDHHRPHHVPEDHQVVHHHFHKADGQVEHITVTVPTNHQGAPIQYDLGTPGRNPYEIYKLDNPINPRLETTQESPGIGIPHHPIKPSLKRPNYNQHFKRSNGKGPNPGPIPGRRNPIPPQPNRRRTPPKNRDLAPSESTYVATPARDRQGTVQPNPTAPADQGSVTLSPPRRVNYNYHPIIDFFESERVQERADFLTSLGDSEWRPVTAYGLAQQQPKEQRYPQ